MFSLFPSSSSFVARLRAADHCRRVVCRTADQKCCRRLFGWRGQGNAVEGDPAMRVHSPAVEARRENADAQDRRPARQLQEMEQRQPLAQAGTPAHVTRLTQAVGDQPRDFLRRRAGIGLETGRRGQQTQQPFERDNFFQQRNQRCQQPDMSAQNPPAPGRYGFRVLQQ